ncbi:MAG TPA: alcohol dehydrogenase catalytic domain-containing protein, partial [Marmoricola sp.]|nr:alcohol dehydrogenase catalytic domain-containing protein [Marmoricola sp.]
MKALVYEGPGAKSWTQVPDPGLKDPEDAIVEVEAVTICGTDLHILGGDVPEVGPGRVLGHEAVGTVVEVGAGVHEVAVGQRVLVSCISACGRCRYCREGRYGQCRGGGGWILGHTVDGTQAEYVRTPFADRSLYPLPAGVEDEQALMFADILPTSYEVGVLAGRVSPGDTVAVVGAGPIGLAAIRTAQLFSPAHVLVVDPARSRRELALRMGADAALAPDDDVAEVLGTWTDGLGADVAIEAVGVPSSFEMCTELVRPGGHVANVGVHGRPATFHLEQLWIKDVTVTTGLVDTSTTPLLLRLLALGRLDVADLVTHRFALDHMEDAYDTFAHAADTRALKVALTREVRPEHLP